MQNKYMLLIFSLMLIGSANAETDWKNPAILCPEEALPRGLDCPDFSSVTDVYTQFPASLSKEEITDWTTNKPLDLRLCRNKEVLLREKIRPGSFPDSNLKGAWMIVDGGNSIKEKLLVVNDASVKYGIPPHILIGALKQESGMSSIGVAPDGGNYSCGMAQMNIQEWCESMNKLPEEKRAELGWPQISCESLPTNIIKPFYDIALKRNAGIKTSYQMTAADYKDITATDVNLSENVFMASHSFLQHCQDFSLAITFKAQILKDLFVNFVPQSLKVAELYSASETFPRTCEKSYPVAAYPLHTGWLMAVAMYNAGPVQAKLVGHYFKVQNNEFPSINPLGLIEALHWGGKWKPDTDTVVFQDQKGKEFTQRWYKSCVVQKHVAKVIQHVTMFSQTIAKSLDLEGCKPTIPEYRKVSSGIKE
jgi:hypothetical protein